MKKTGNKIKDRKQKEQKQKVVDILGAAKKVFYSKGFQKTTMDEIAYEAGLSKPTIYKFYPTKEDLFFSLVRPALKDILHEMENINMQLQLNMYSSGNRLVRDIIYIFHKKYTEDPNLFRIGQLFQQTRMLLDIGKDTEEKIRGLSRLFMNEMRSIFDSAVHRGLIADINRYNLVDILIGSFFGVVQLQDSKSRGSENAGQIDQVIEMTVQLFINAVVIK